MWDFINILNFYFMEAKLGKLQKFVASLELDVVQDEEQALLFVGGSGSSGATNDACINTSDCRGTVNSGCTNSGLC